MPLTVRAGRDHPPWPSGDTPGPLTGLHTGRAGSERPAAEPAVPRRARDPADVPAKCTFSSQTLQKWLLAASPPGKPAHPQRKLGAQGTFLGASPGAPQGRESRRVSVGHAGRRNSGAVATPLYPRLPGAGPPSRIWVPALMPPAGFAGVLGGHLSHPS